MNRLVVVSNRVPLPSSGSQAGGLSVALHGLMARRGGLWFGWSGAVSEGSARGELKRETAASIDYVTFDLSAEEHNGYYNKFSNGVLWPLLHTLPELMDYDRLDARTYRDVNDRIAEMLVSFLRPTDLVWIHDYHLLPLPMALRSRHVHNPIGFFLHIPFAPADVLGAAPEMASFIRDMLGADVIGFQTDNDMRNFAGAAQQLAGATRLTGNTLQVGSRRVKLGVFPVEIDATEFARIAADMAKTGASDRLRKSLTAQSLVLGMDRLDPTKGLIQRVAGLRRLFEKYPAWKRRVTALQIAASSRGDVESYRSLRTTLDHDVGSLNGDFADPDWTPLRLITRGVARNIGAGYMRIACVGLITPLRDGMNLVAKEFVAAQNPVDPGVLVLSRFAGAARQLDGAILVNPYDADALADALDVALKMGQEERVQRWTSMWSQIEDRTPVQWGRNFVATLVRVSSGASVHMPDPAQAGFVVGEPSPRERLPAMKPAELDEKSHRNGRLN